jgi:hypothetical protein
VTNRDVLLLGLLPEVRLTKKTSEAHRWVWMYVEARHALLCLPPALC